MNIKSLLIGSAAALAAVSGAQAADAIVAAEPEAVEYVRVCDAFGTGYFYIPGTETCLRIGGYARVQLNVGNNSDSGLTGLYGSAKSDYDIFARGRLRVDAKNDTEFGALWSRVQIRVRASEGTSDATSTDLEEGFIELGGLRVGKFYSWWDDGLPGETDTLSTNSNFASVRYIYSGDAFSFGLSIDELTDSGIVDYDDANIGITPYLSATFGDVKATVFGSYDVDAEAFAVTGALSAAIGPGTLSLAGIYASDPNSYYRVSEWTVAGVYAFKATDKLTILPAFQYFGNYGVVGNDFGNDDAWRVGLTTEYKIVSGLTALATLNYTDADNRGDATAGFLRLQRDF